MSLKIMLQNVDLDYSSDDDDDDCTNDLEMLFEDDALNTKYNLVLCEPYNHKIHGVEHLNNEFIVNCRFKKLNLPYFHKIKNYLLANYIELPDHKLKHKIIRNYKIILGFNLFPEIAECYYTDTGEMLCIKKTFWIKIIQKTWKNVFKRRQSIIMKMKSLKHLKHRELSVNGPVYTLPTLTGMLYKLNKK